MAFPFQVPAYRGDWSSTTAAATTPMDLRYLENNIVTFRETDGAINAYICLTANTTEQPSATATDWRLYSTGGSGGNNPAPVETFTTTLSNPSIRVDSTDRTFTLNLGVGGEGFTYTGYQNLVTPAGLTTNAPAMATVTDGMDSVLTFTLPDPLVVATYTITGQLLSTNAAGPVNPHPFSVTFRVVALPVPTRDVFFGYATSADTGTAARMSSTISYTDLAMQTDTNVVAASGNEFDISGTTSATVQDLVILIPTGFGLRLFGLPLTPNETITTVTNLPDGLTGYQALRLYNTNGAATYRIVSA